MIIIYQIYSKKKGVKRWLKILRPYSSKYAASRDMKWFNKKDYDFKIKKI